MLTRFATDVSLHEMLLNVCAKWMLMNVSNSGFFGTCVFVPVVDGTLITKRATELLRAGRVNGISIPKTHVLDLVSQEVLLAVTTSAEGTSA